MKTQKWEKLANEYVVSLFPAFTLPMAMRKMTERLLKSPVSISFKIENDAIDWYYFSKNWGAGHIKLKKKVRKSPSFLRLAYKKMMILGEKQIAYAQSTKKKLTRASNTKLFQYYEKFVDYNSRSYECGLLLPLLDFHTTVFLADELHDILKKRGKDQLFNLLTIPYLQTTVAKQELDLLKILQVVNKYPECRRLFLSQEANTLTRTLGEQFPKVLKKIEDHTRKYCFAYFNYEGPAANKEYFIGLLQELVKRKINPSKKLEEHHKHLKATKEEQEMAVRKLKLNPYERQIAELTRDGVFYKAHRRELQSCSYYHIEPLLSEIGRRLYLSLKQVRMLLPDEVGSALKNQKNFLDVIQERQKLLYCDYTADRRFVCLSGEKARKFLEKNVVLEKINVNLTSFSGTVAYPGSVRGRVKIINFPDEMVKMVRGDILVAMTTSPSLMPAIRMASAIVTEEGGLTCHAAIVARELRIPCVVGAKPVARVLKDGDMVEVDADKGIVRILQ